MSPHPAFFPRRSLLLCVMAAAAACTTGESSLRLSGYAVLPAATFAAGPPSGAHLGASSMNGQSLPFSRQPVQGFSALLATPDPGVYFAMADNGYGAIENSADFNLRVYRIRPELREQDGSGSGGITVLDSFELRDPNKHVPFAIRNFFTPERVLTGADLDIESMRQAPDGTFWFGDEFGPFLVHTDASGKVLEPPIPLSPPGLGELRAPQNPFSEESSALRVMNALDAHAQAAGSKTPVFSPAYQLLVDHDPMTFVSSRTLPPQGSGVKAASSEIFDVASIKKAGYPVVAWTVNDVPQMHKIMQLGVSGLISDRPDLLLEAVRTFDGNKDGKPDFLTAEGLIDAARFDAQGHRGGRDLRPENTLPAMEAALDLLMTTLESDVGITSDGIAVLSHDPHIMAQKCRRSDGKPYELADEVLISERTVQAVQSDYVCDKLFRGPAQKNDPALSPVAVEFARTAKLPNLYAVPTVQQLFDFVAAYVTYYRDGAGKAHAEAALRVRNAQKIRYNLETKINPRKEFAARTAGPEVFADTLAAVIERNGLSARADIQSFDFRTLVRVQKMHPQIRTVCLFGDFPRFTDASIAGSDDGTNLQDEDGKPSPWLAGLPWPYRITADTQPQRVRASGGFEGMALSADGTRLLPMLEKPLADEQGFLRVFEFDLRSRQYLAAQRRYPLNEGATSVGEFLLLDERTGLTLERDDSEGSLTGLKHIYQVELAPTPGTDAQPAPMSKQLLVNLLDIPDPDLLAGSGQPGDIGLGARYAMPYFTIESILPLGPDRLAVMNDNNFPLSVGRHAVTRAPDDNEFVVLRLPKALPFTARPAP